MPETGASGILRDTCAERACNIVLRYCSYRSAIRPLEQMSEVDYKALVEFRSQLRRFLRKSEDAAVEVGLQPRQYQVLLIVKGLDADGIEPSISMIANRLHLRHHSVVGLIDRLEKKELVTRHKAATDQRAVTVRLTEEGNILIEKLSRFHQETLRSLGPDLVAVLQNIVGDSSKNGAAH
jgi:DNA-binding MarR family transcriptional regulator